MKGNIFWIILFVAALLVPFVIGQYLDGELFTLDLFPINMLIKKYQKYYTKIIKRIYKY